MVRFLKTSVGKLTFQQWLKLQRGIAGVSQAQIAENLGVKPQTVGNWEGGRSVPSLDPDQMWKLCDQLGVTLETLAKAFRGEISVDE